MNFSDITVVFIIFTWHQIVFDVCLNTKIALQVLGILDRNSNLTAVCEQPVFFIVIQGIFIL